MEKEITGVDTLLGTITEEPSAPGKRVMENGENLFGMTRPSWGTPASLDAGDAGSRLGINMGEPTVKSAALRFALLQDAAASEEKLAGIAGEVVKGGIRAGKALYSGAKSLLGFGAKGTGKVVTKAHEGGKASRAHFAKKRVARKAKAVEDKKIRAAKHQENLRNADGIGGAMKENLRHGAKETWESGVVGKGMGAAGLTWTADDLIRGTQVTRNRAAGRTGRGR